MQQHFGGRLRSFLRTKTAQRTQRIRSLSAIPIGIVTGLIAFGSKPLLAIVSGVIGGCIGALGNYYIYKPLIRSDIRRYLKRELAGRLPTPVTYSVHEGRLKCESLGVTTILSLSDLSSISEDDKRLELIFGPKGLCTIPFRAFSSQEEKSGFLEKLKTEVRPSE